MSTRRLVATQVLLLAAVLVATTGGVRALVLLVALAAVAVAVAVVLRVPVFYRWDRLGAHGALHGGRRLIGRLDARDWPDEAPPPLAIHRLRDLDRRQRVGFALLLTLVIVTGVRVVADLMGQDAVVVGDEALISLFAHDAFHDTPLIGKVTSAGLYGVVPPPHNPGPAESWTLAPFVLLLGTTTGAWVYAYAVNLGCALLAAWAGFRRNGPRGGLVVLVTSLVMFAVTAPGGIASVLNTRIVLMPLFATMVVAGAVALGDTALLALLVVLASFVVQTHIGYGPVAVTAAGAALAMVAWAHRSHRASPRLKTHVAWAAGAGIVCWVLPIWDQLFASGNLGELLTAQVPRGGLGRAFDTLGTMINPAVIFFDRGEVSPPSFAWPSALLGIGIVVFAVLVVWTQRRRLAAHRGLLVVAVACLLAAVFTGGMTPPTDVGGEHYYWLRAVAFFVTLALIAVLASPPSTDPDRRPRRLVAGIGAGVVLVALVPLWVPKDFSNHDRHTMDAVHALLPAVEETTDRPQPVALAHQGPWPAIAVADGIVTELTDRGIAVTQVDASRLLAGHTTLVVTQGPERRGAPLASSEAARDAEETAWVPDAVAEWARAHGPLELVGPGALHLESVLDGTSAVVCIDRYVDDPDLLLDLDPAIVTDLYFQQQVAAPQLPAALLSDLEDWMLGLPTELYQARPYDLALDSNLVLSRPGC